jgi:broad specificity phosphatase PhoE
MRFGWVVLLALTVLGGDGLALAQEAEPAPPPPIVEALRQGGYVVYLRHAATDFSQADTQPNDLTNCAAQRNLTDLGRGQAQAIGEAMAALGVPIGEVLSSEYCRTLETALLAFGRATPSLDLTGIASLPSSELNRRLEALRVLLATPPAEGTNTVLVSHQFNLRDAMGVLLGTEGEAAIYQPDGLGGTSLVARVLPGEWATFVSPVTHDGVTAVRNTDRHE